MDKIIPLEDKMLDTDAAAKLTEWKNEPSVRQLKEDLQISKSEHDTRVGRIRHWLNLRNVEGEAKPKVSGENRSKVQPKLIRRQNEWRYSALSEPFLSADTLFDIAPATWEDVKGAEQNSLVLEHQFRNQIKRVKFIDKYVRTAVDEGIVYVRVGWKRETRKVKKTVPNYAFYRDESPENVQRVQQAYIMRVQNYNAFLDLDPALIEAVEYARENQMYVRAVQEGTVTVEEEEVLKNEPTLDILPYQNVYLDPSAEGDVEKATFGILTFETSKAELLKDGRYTNLERVNWSTNTPAVNTDHKSMLGQDQQFNDDLRKRVVAYEYWGWYDIHGDDTLVPIVATWIGDTLVRMEENPYPDKGIPIVAVPYMPDKETGSGEPDAELLEEPQKILGAVTRGMIDLMGRSANGQTAFAKGFLDPVNRRRYDKGMDYEYNPSQHPDLGIYAHKYPEIPNSALTMLNLQNQEAESLTGVKAFSGGLSGEAYGEVAAGIRGMLDAASKREMSILRRLAEGMAEIGKKMIAMNQAFLSEEEVVRITNEEFVTVRREELAGQFDIKVDISTAEVEEAKAQDLAFMLQTIGNSMDPTMVMMILAQIAKLKRMPALAKMIEQYQPQPEPLEQKKKELELARLELELQELRTKAMLNEAKAREVAASADLKDLDFLEQETGTKHAREVDLQGAQARANQALEITKFMLNPQPGGDLPSARQAIS
jgi:hypothetical protein